ncbi:hypothetical protein HYR69_04665 [Candidatus Sumerlaeota bacterium]|nr:hypothetical protein [Candidatus Sumerlaeota bacterium]
MSFELLKSLADAHGVSGREGEVRDVIRAALAGMGLSAEEDALGNLFVEAGGDPAGPPVLLDAHMDEIGLMVSHISPWGQLSFATMGGWDARNLPAQEVTIRAKKGKVAGVIGSKPPHILKGDESSKAWSVESLWIDVGAMSEAETRDLGIEVGDPVVLDGHCAQLREGLIRGKALDDRVGCYVILETLRVLRSEKLPIRLCASFTTSEEVGLRGIGVIGRRADWAAALGHHRRRPLDNRAGADGGFSRIGRRRTQNSASAQDPDLRRDERRNPASDREGRSVRDHRRAVPVYSLAGDAAQDERSRRDDQADHRGGEGDAAIGLMTPEKSPSRAASTRFRIPRVGFVWI